jgi:hypothetical protein
MRILNATRTVFLMSCILLLAGCRKSAPPPQPQPAAQPQSAAQPPQQDQPPAPVQPVQVTDVNAVVAGLLQAHGPVSSTRQITVQVPYTQCVPQHSARPDYAPPPDCHPALRAVQQNQTSQAILTASNIRIASNTEMTFGQLTQTSLPDELAAASLDVCNPTPTTGSQNASFSQQITQNNSVTLTHTVTNTLADTIGGSRTLSDPSGDGKGGLTLSNQLQIGTSNATATAALSGNALTQTIQLQVTQQIPAQSRYGIEFLITPTRFSVPFSVNVTVDADLSQNDAGLTLLSQIADAPTRTFLIDGTVNSTVGLHAHSLWVELPWDPPNCAAGSGSSITTRPLTFAPNLKVINHQ